MDISHLATLAKNKAPFLIGGLGIILLSTALGIEYIKSNQKTSDITFTQRTGETDLVEADSFSRKMIKIDIEGAVQKPGIYEIPDDSRIQDVLITAGGLIAKADRTTISRTINLAQHLFDGQKIYFPEVGETAANTPISQPSQSNSGIVNINTASESDLDTLPGVGPVTAAKIIAGRPYQNISDLITKHLVGQSVYDKIKASISIN